MGCYEHIKPSEGLLRDHETRSQDMTIEACGTICREYKYFGISAGSWCYCGDTFRGKATAADPNTCTSRCAGNQTQTCGSPWRMSLFTTSI
ncbi:carbohydrate-binding WSC [Alternaria rosae]|uniref:carbohydrate-binding WSC n=1 Tax=Alternaria rosae TaxID=1187941 RepID=UPI001E8E0103|nr:carbohydrate-binding WSC [Alternaria rosae]KAH6870211.1 carbohydrate-binding WSC [Alternaria rosae]